MTQIIQGSARLAQLGCIRAQGRDASVFLQGQLTQDVALWDTAHARLAAWCSAKGRMLASFVLFKRSEDEILLVCHRDVLPATLKRLQMFVMRAQCKLTDASADFEIFGRLDALEASESAIHSIAYYSEDMPANVLKDGEISIILPPARGNGIALQRTLRLRPKTGQTEMVEAEKVQALLDEAVWNWAEVLSGVAPVSLPIVDAFVPQMLNYESIGGVNFKKGCYPGQEVVARSQFRGTLKRRAFIVHSETPLQAGQEVFNSLDLEQPCGMVACAAAVPTAPELANLAGPAGYVAIVSLQIASTTQGHLLLSGIASDLPGVTQTGEQLCEATGTQATEQSPRLTLMALPYTLRDDI